MKTALVVDASDAVLKIVQRILTDLGFAVILAHDVIEVLERLDDRLPDILIVDSTLSGAMDLVVYVRRSQGGSAARVFLSAIAVDLSMHLAGKRRGVDAFLLKPFDRTSLSAALLRGSCLP